MADFCNPMAADALKSYRYRGRWGYIMIEAKNGIDALRGVKRLLSRGENPERCNIDVWDEKLNCYKSLGS